MLRLRGVKAIHLTVALLMAVLLMGLQFETRTVRAQTDDPDLLRELALRELTPQYPGPNGEAPQVRLLPGALPPELPFSLPLPPNSRLIGSVVRTFPPNGGNTDIILDAPGTPADLIAFYDGALTDLGYTVGPTGGPAPGGFAPIPVQNRGYCPVDSGGPLFVNVFSKESGPSDVRLNIPAGGPGPCFPVGPGGPRPPQLPPGADRVPQLSSPANVALSAAGSQPIGPGIWGSNATATTTMSVQALESFYAQQLVAAGWARVEGEAGDALSWSSWQLPGDGDYTGFLYVRVGGVANQRLLHVEVAPAQLPPL